ncbi:hypothetical protein SMD44_00744 [Streptomyces alboflavus]|uniref:Chromosome segregation ATPase n=1 Tax=Streptomyces alboflavus TaxID=67267 RepID=A0A1Z1W4J9_9ACTN|nr:hypothetical protein [Streptomyces alboflavus]ARX81346.1 hypothetical protein SMD44_00744 [Streptomyces alboflavus]
MHYELSRVRLCSVGPAGARFQDVTLDFSGVGKPVTQEQDDLFSSAAQTLRPSPASVVFLENGGGKSVLLKLVFSVLLPGWRPVKGANDPRLLGDYVLAQDVSHVVLEWTHSLTGQVLVTGKVMAWKNQTASRIADNLQEGWYYFLPQESLSLDSLPVTDDNRYLSFDAYRRQLHDLHDEDPRLGLNWPKTQSAWTELLGKLDIDSELFQYQRVMNRDEGEAVRAFDLDSDANFVDFLLEAVAQHDGLTELAGLVAKHVHKLAQRQTLLLEQEFVARVLDMLEPLTDAARAVDDAREDVARAQGNLENFASRVKRRVRDDETLLRELDEQAARLKGDLDAAVHLAERWRLTAAEQQVTLAAMHLTNAEADVNRTISIRKKANAVVAGWQATAVVLRHQEKSGEERALRDLVDAGEEQALPALRERDAAARAFAGGLLALVRTARSQARSEDAEAEKHEKAEDKVRGEREEALKAAAGAESETESLNRLVRNARSDADRAVSAGLVENAEDVPQAAKDAIRALDGLQSKIRTLREEEDSLSAEQSEAQGELDKAKEGEVTARRQAEGAQAHLDHAMGLKADLESESRIAELLDGQTPNLEQDAQALADHLAESVAEAEREHIALRVEEARDQQARLALADGRLLPPPDLVTEACRLLLADGIHAWPGWEHIADYPERKREELIARVPHLVSGILLNDPDRLADARRLIARTAPGATAYVAVGTTKGFEDPATGQESGTDFFLPFHPALHNPDAAEAEHHAIEQRHTVRVGRLDRLTASKRADDVLRQRIIAWQEKYPAVVLAGLRESLDLATEEALAAQKLTTDRQRTVASLIKRRAENSRSQRAAHDENERLGEASRRLTALAERLALVPTWTDSLLAAETTLRHQNDLAEKAKNQAAEHRRLVDELKGTAGQQRRIADEAHKEWAGIPGVQELILDEEAPQTPIPSLRSAFTTACDNYAKADVPEELRRALGRAEKEATAARTEYTALDDAERDHAHRLLLTPEASDAVTRAEARQRAVRVKEAAERAAGQAQLLQGNCESTLRERQEELRPLARDGLVVMPLPFQPHDILTAQEAVARATTEHAAAATVEKEARAQHESAEGQLNKARDAARELAVLATTLASITPEESATEPYGDDSAAALGEHRRLDQAKNTAQEALAKHERTLRLANERLTRHAAKDTYESLATPVRRQILNLPPEQVTAQAPGWRIALAARLRSLADDLDQIGRHRQVIIDHLKGEVDRALAILRSAQRVSTLPRSLGDWAEQEFLQFSFERLAKELLVARMGEVVDEAAVGRTGDGRRVQRDGLSLLLRGVHAAVPKGFKVFVLKPDIVLRAERVRVSKVKKIFSGGQQLTAAILLYCTMASLRANSQGRKRSRHAGVLFLDNPIGRANADYLLDLQRSVAEALGVQLIYTTGLFDENALGQFPLIIRLRNDADLRAALKYLIVEEPVRNRLDRLGPPDGTGRLTAARVFSHDAEGPQEHGP